jgi:hypothetical protein
MFSDCEKQWAQPTSKQQSPSLALIVNCNRVGENLLETNSVILMGEACSSSPLSGSVMYGK